MNRTGLPTVGRLARAALLFAGIAVGAASFGGKLVALIAAGIAAGSSVTALTLFFRRENRR